MMLCGYHFFIKLLASWLQESERNNTHSSGNFKVSDAATCLYTQNSSSKIADICFNFFFYKILYFIVCHQVLT